MSQEAGIVTYDRQQLVVDQEAAKNTKMVLFGCGTVGSNVAVEAAKLGIGSFELYDYDEVEGHNIPSQRFSKNDIGSSKVEALAQQIASVSSIATIKTHNNKVDGPVILPTNSIVVLGVDSMEYRKKIWDQSIKHSNAQCMFDWRMSGNLMHGYYIGEFTDDNIKAYDSTLYTDDAADDTPCGGRTVSYTGAIIGGIQANYIRKALKAMKIPFNTQMDLDAMDMIA